MRPFELIEGGQIHIVQVRVWAHVSESKHSNNMVKAPIPELKQYMDKRVFCQINAGRKVTGVLRGFDPFMNIILDTAVEELSGGEKHNIGTVVLRGNSIMLLEALDRLY